MQDTVKLTILFLATLLPWTGSQSNAASEQGDTPNAESSVGKRQARTAIKYLPAKGGKKLDVPYKTTAEGKLCMDVYYPAVQPLKNLPTLIYTHGGGWAAGSKQGIAAGVQSRACLKLLDAGFCVVSVDYRLCKKDGDVAMRDCVIDCKDAVRYLAKHSEALGLDPRRFCVLGDSAGGQIAQMLLLSSPQSLPGDAALADAHYRMVAGVSWYGPCDFQKTDLFNPDDRPGFRDRFGARILKPDTDPKDRLKLYREMSPIQYLKKDSPPLLMIQGDKDTTIPVKHAHYMKEKAEAAHAPVEIMIIKNAGHNWREVGAPIEPTTDEIVQHTVHFLTDHLKGTR
jgi:acetyl esterase/lipase